MSYLLLEPHSDDAVLFASWTILRHRPHIVTVLRSVVQDAYGIAHETRVAENLAAFRVLGVEDRWTQWPYSDAGPSWVTIEGRLRGEFPDVERVFAPAVEGGGHEHHNMIGMIAGEVFGDRLTYYRTYRGSPAVKVTEGVEVPFEDEWILLKLAALGCYRSQILSGTGSRVHFTESLREFYAS